MLLNPTYESLRPSLSDPAQLMTLGTAIHRGRNELHDICIDGVRICIKRYGIPNAFQRLVYRYLRTPKGLRAWQHSFALREAGFDSPEPVAYIEDRSWRGIGDSYYLCRFIEGETLYRWGDCSAKDIAEDIHALGVFAARLHEAGMMLCDFTPGNILRTKEGFALVDTNRMRFGQCSIERGLKNMAGLWLQPETADLLAQTYARARGAQDAARYTALMAQCRRAFWRRFARRHDLTDHIVHRDLDGSQYTYHFKSTIQ